MAYILVLAVGFSQAGLDRPIIDPVLAVMEALTLISAPAILVAIAAIHQNAPPDRKILALVSLSFSIAFAVLTSAVHFVSLTASRQLGIVEITWPSAAYAVELLAWDWFLGLALLFAAPVFAGEESQRLLRRSFWLCGVLTLAGSIGPLAGDMRLQRIGILGYAGVLPLCFFLLARFFRAQRSRS